MWRALENFTKYYDRAIWTCPVKWDPTKKQMIYIPFSKSLIPWGVAVFGFTLLLINASATLLLLELYGVSEISFISGITAFLCWILCMFGFVGEIVCLHGKDWLHAINCLVHLYRSKYILISFLTIHQIYINSDTFRKCQHHENNQT
jgi:hypothetical protein